MGLSIYIGRKVAGGSLGIAFAVFAVSHSLYAWEKDSSQIEPTDSLSEILSLSTQVNSFVSSLPSLSPSAISAVPVLGGAVSVSPTASTAKEKNEKGTKKESNDDKVTQNNLNSVSAPKTSEPGTVLRTALSVPDSAGRKSNEEAKSNMTVGNLKNLIDSTSVYAGKNLGMSPIMGASFLSGKFFPSIRKGEGQNKTIANSNKKSPPSSLRSGSAQSRQDRDGATTSVPGVGLLAAGPGIFGITSNASVNPRLTPEEATDSFEALRKKVGEQDKDQEKEKKNGKSELDPDKKLKLTEISKATPHTPEQLDDLVSMMNGDPNSLSGNTDYANTLKEVYDSVNHDPGLNDETRELADQYLQQNDHLLTRIPRPHSNLGSSIHQ